MNHSRPKNLNLLTIKFPLPAIVSILHRITGVILFLLVPFILWMLQFSLTEAGYQYLQSWFDQIYFKMAIWLLLIPFLFHLVAGIRHLLMDVHIGTSLKTGRFLSGLTFVVSVMIILLVGIWLW